MPSLFDKHAHEANEQFEMLSTNLGIAGDYPTTARILRAVLHSLRDVIPVEESLHMLSQLPFFMKALYVDGWKMKAKPIRIKDLEDFIDLVKSRDNKSAIVDFDDDYITFSRIQVVLNFLKRFVSFGEISDIKATMPNELRIIWDGKITAL